MTGVSRVTRSAKLELAPENPNIALTRNNLLATEN